MVPQPLSLPLCFGLALIGCRPLALKRETKELVIAKDWNCWRGASGVQQSPGQRRPQRAASLPACGRLQAREAGARRHPKQSNRRGGNQEAQCLGRASCGICDRARSDGGEAARYLPCPLTCRRPPWHVLAPNLACPHSFPCLFELACSLPVRPHGLNPRQPAPRLGQPRPGRPTLQPPDAVMTHYRACDRGQKAIERSTKVREGARARGGPNCSAAVVAGLPRANLSPTGWLGGP